MPRNSEEIWVTGLGCISPAGKNIEDGFNALCSGVRPQQATSIFQDSASERPVCMVNPEWIHEAGYTWRENSAAATLALACIAADAAVAKNNLKGSSLGVSIGTTAGNALHFLEGYRQYFNGQLPAIDDMRDVQAYFECNLASSIQQRYGGTGPLLTASNACTSGTDAIGTAMEWLKLGLCDYALAGGADALSFIPYIGFARLMIYSDQACKPFDKNRSGLNLGEGAGMLLMERAAHAKKRGAVPLAVISGYGAASDAHHFTAPHPEGAGLTESIKKAFATAGISATDLAFVNAHGTATRENDKTEGGVFNAMLPAVPIWASKGSTGHCLGAAGAIEAAFTVMALQKGFIPPSAGCDQPEDLVKENLVLARTNINKKHALSVSLGFGGGNSAIVISVPE